jgi:hypothetical protein
VNSEWILAFEDLMSSKMARHVINERVVKGGGGSDLQKLISTHYSHLAMLRTGPQSGLNEGTCVDPCIRAVAKTLRVVEVEDLPWD